MVDRDSTTIGFALYGSERKTRLLLPIQIADQLASQAELAEQKAAAEKAAAKLAEQKAAAEKAAEFFKSKSRHAPHANAEILKKIDFDLGSIRAHTKYDLSDAMTLASSLLAKSEGALDRVSARMSTDLLIAISLELGRPIMP